MITVYISSSCLSSRKVIQFFDKNNIRYVIRNIIQSPPSQNEIKLLLQFAPNGLSDIISTRAKYIKNHMINIESLKLSEVYDLIKNSPTILKRPIIIQETKKRLQVGYNEDEIELFLRDKTEKKISNQYKIF